MNLNALCNRAFRTLLNLLTAVAVSFDRQLKSPGTGEFFCKPWNRDDSKPPSVWLSKQTMRVMKLTAILIFSVFVTVSAEGVAQKISLNVTDASLESILRDIKSQTGLFYLIDKEYSASESDISLHLN